MRKIVYLSILVLASCQALHRGIPKAPRNRIVLQETAEVEKQNNLNSEVYSDEKEAINSNDNELSSIESTKAQKVQGKSSELKLFSPKQSELKTVTAVLADTLIIDQSELDRGERISKNQKAINIALVVTFFGFYLATIFIIWGLINISLANNLPYVTKEVDDQLKERKRNFLIILGVKLFLLVFLIALVFLVF